MEVAAMTQVTAMTTRVMTRVHTLGILTTNNHHTVTAMTRVMTMDSNYKQPSYSNSYDKSS